MKKDFCSHDGACRLEKIIAAYWESQGFPVPEFTKKIAGFDSRIRAARVDLRSTMKNGSPIGGQGNA